MLKTTFLKVFARDLSRIIAFIKAVEDHLESLIAKERAKAAQIGSNIADIMAKAELDIAKLEEQAMDTERTIAIALGLKKAAGSAAATPTNLVAANKVEGDVVATAETPAA